MKIKYAKNSIAKIILFNTMVGLSSFLSCNSSLANSAQVFPGIAYDNPARLTQVQGSQIILGGTWVGIDYDFTGTVGRNTGTASGDGTLLLPYFRYAKRFTDKFVMGIDVTEPFASDVNWPITSIAAPVSTHTKLTTVDVAPTLAYDLTQQLSVGAGPDVQYANAELDNLVSIRRVGTGEFINQGTDVAGGWHAGVAYTVAKTHTVLGVSYLSRFIHRIVGESTFLNRESIGANTVLNLPATTTLTLIQPLSQHWILAGTANYSQWEVLNNITLYNTALGNLRPILFNYHNTWRYGLGGQYIFTNKWALKAGVSYDETPTFFPDRSLALPNEDLLGIKVGVHSQLTKVIGVDVDYGHSFVDKEQINNLRTLTNGVVDIEPNSVEARLTLNMA